MVRIRMKRTGRRHHSMFRIVVTDDRFKRDGRNIEILGYVDPHQKDIHKKVKVNAERTNYWLSVGAQPNPTCRDLLRKVGIEIKSQQKPSRRKQQRDKKKQAAAS